MRLSRFNLLSRFGLQLLMTFMSVFQQVIVVSFFAAHWSEQLYASWLVMVAVSNLLIVADLGMHSHTYLSLQKAFSAEKPVSDKKIGQITISSTMSYLTISCFLLLVSGLVCIFFPMPDWFNLSGASDFELRLSLFLSLATGAGLVFNSCYSAMLRAKDQLNLLSLLRIAHTVITVVITIYVLRQGYGIVSVTATYLVTQWSLNAVLQYFVRKHIPSFLKGENSFRFDHLKETLSTSKRYIIPVSSELLLLNIPTLVMGLLARPGKEIVIFTLTRTIISFIRQIAMFATYPAANEISQLWLRGEKDGARRAILLSLAIAGSGTGILAGFFAVFSLNIIQIWTHGVYDGDPIMLGLQLLNIALAFPAITATTALMYTDQPALITKTKVAQIATLAALSVFLGSNWGARGVTAAVLFAEFFMTCLPLTLAMKSVFGFNSRTFYIACLLPFLSSLTVSFTVALVVHGLLSTQNIFSLIAAGLLWLPLPAIVALWIFVSYTKAHSKYNGAEQ